MGKSAVVFDFDNTITKTDTIKYLLLSLAISDPITSIVEIKKNLKQFKSSSAIKHGIISSFIKGKTLNRVSSALLLYKHLVSLSLRKTLTYRMQTAKNNTIIIASASPSFALKEIEILKGKVIIATDYESFNGKYTGKICGSICYGEEKLRRLENFLQSENIDCVSDAYTDHYSDFPLLSIAHNKHLVYPDKHTRSIASSDMKIARY